MLNDFAKDVHNRSVEEGWWRGVASYHDRIAAKFALIHSEISEAMEAYRKNALDTHLPHRPGVDVELADALIRIGDLAAELGCDLDGAVYEKLHYNSLRIDHKPETRAAAGGKRF